MARDGTRGDIHHGVVVAPRACLHSTRSDDVWSCALGRGSWMPTAYHCRGAHKVSDPTKHHTFYPLHIAECISYFGSTNTDYSVARAREASLFPGRA